MKYHRLFAWVIVLAFILQPLGGGGARKGCPAR